MNKKYVRDLPRWFEEIVADYKVCENDEMDHKLYVAQVVAIL